LADLPFFSEFFRSASFPPHAFLYLANWFFEWAIRPFWAATSLSHSPAPIASDLDGPDRSCRAFSFLRLFLSFCPPYKAFFSLAWGVPPIPGPSGEAALHFFAGFSFPPFHWVSILEVGKPHFPLSGKLSLLRIFCFPLRFSSAPPLRHFPSVVSPVGTLAHLVL